MPQQQSPVVRNSLWMGLWREYRKALRSWPEHEDFPNKESRPVSPLIKEY